MHRFRIGAFYFGRLGRRLRFFDVIHGWKIVPSSPPASGFFKFRRRLHYVDKGFA